MKLITRFLIFSLLFSFNSYSQNCWDYFNASNSGLPHNGVNDIAIHPITNDIWVATSAGLAKFDGINWSVYTTSNSPLPNNFIKTIAFDGFGILWIGGQGTVSTQGFNGIMEFDGINWLYHSVASIWPNISVLPYSGTINDIEVDNLNNVWVAASGGVTKFNRVDWFGYRSSATGLTANNFQTIVVDQQNNIWLGTAKYISNPIDIPGEGIVKFDGSNWTIYDSTNSGLANNEILDLAFDGEQNLWISASGTIGTASPLVMKFDGQNFITFDTLTTGLFIANDVIIDSYGNKWFPEGGTTWRPPGKLVKFDGTSWSAVFASNGVSNLGRGVADTSGNIWMGAAGFGLVKFSCNIPTQPNYTLSGTVFIDDNQNGIKESGESGLQREVIKLVKSSPTYTTTNLSSEYNFVVDTGTFNVSYRLGQYWEATTPTTQTITINPGNYATTGIDFGINPRTDKQDVAVYLTGGRTRCGAIVNYLIDYMNLATKVVDGTLTFTFDNSSLSYNSSFPSADNIFANYLVWNYTGLQPFEHRQLLVKLQVVAPTIGTPVPTSVEIQPLSGDLRTENNYDSLIQFSSCSYDPNDKLVKPAGVGENKLTLFGQEMIYTIRFQNTGNDTALIVTIEDTLDQNLEVQTFKFIGSSHLADFDIKGTGIVEFTLNNVMLPDSNVDYTGSQGFVKYSIHPKDSLPENTIISNRGAIIFDSNSPIITNTVFNTLVSSIPTTVGTILKPNNSIQIFPNPVASTIEIAYNPNSLEINSIEIYNLQGKMIKTFENSKSIIISELPSGLYFLTFRDKMGGILNVKKVIKQ